MIQRQSVLRSPSLDKSHLLFYHTSDAEKNLVLKESSRYKIDLDEIQYFIWTRLWIKAFPTLIHYILLPYPSTDDDSDCVQPSATECTLSYLTSSVHVYLSVLAHQSLLEKYHETKPLLNRLQYDSIDRFHSPVRNFDAHNDKNLTYGEIHPKSIAWCIQYICSHYWLSNGSPFTGGTIVDLGSGNGKALLAASLMHPYRQAVGIEIVPSLHHAARYLLETTIGNEYLFLDQRQGTTIFTTLNGDLTCVDTKFLDDADTILVHATMFDNNLMNHIHRLCRACKDGTYFIMISQCLVNDRNSQVIHFETIMEVELSMSWGKTCVFIQRKIIW